MGKMKNYVKKFLTLAITGIMACTALVGCGGSGAKDAAGSDSLTVKDGVLRVAMECGYAPYNWTQPTDENGAVPITDSPDYAYGYDVMMAKHVAEKLGLELEIVKLDWDSLVPAVQSGTVDCVIAGQSITSDRLEQVDFTTPYYYASIISLVACASACACSSSVFSCDTLSRMAFSCSNSFSSRTEIC